MLTELTIKRLEVLVTLANNPDGLPIEDFVDNGLRTSAEYLCDNAYATKTKIYPKHITVTKSIGQNDPRLGYKINKEGKDLINKILKYANDLVLI
ncbi:MAG: hypothetical protein AABX61_02425 [Nanoarchaeota archaeon]